MTLKFHPKISFSVYHVLYSLMISLIANEYPPLWPELWVGTKTLWLEMRMDPAKCLRRTLDSFCSIPMKSSTLTSIIHMASCKIDGLDGSSVLSIIIVCFSSGCSGRLPIFSWYFICNVSFYFRGRTEVCRKFNPSHLKTVWNDDICFFCILFWG